MSTEDPIAAMVAKAAAEGAQVALVVLDDDVCPPTDIDGFRGGAKVSDLSTVLDLAQWWVKEDDPKDVIVEWDEEADDVRS